MSILFYMRLAAQNIRKNSRTYVPYILTCIGSVMVFNILLSLSLNTDLDDIYGGSNMRMILCLGCIIIAVFTGLFLFYTNSFLIKRRKTEIGLFNILGMEKKHIGRIMFFETVTIAMISLTGGIGGGFLLSKGVYLLLLRMVRAEVQWGFHFSGNAAAVTVIFYGWVFPGIWPESTCPVRWNCFAADWKGNGNLKQDGSRLLQVLFFWGWDTIWPLLRKIPFP